LQSQLSVVAIRFQYRGQPERRGNWETMPFYLNHLRGFLQGYDGDVVWLKGHTGGDEAAYLIFNDQIRDEVRRLLSQPLPELGIYEITAEPEPVEVLRKYYRDGKIGVGRLQVWEEQVGEEIVDAFTRIVRQGFWYAPKGTPTGAIFLKAKNVTQHWHENEPWLCLQEVEETVCDSEGNRVGVESHSELWLRETAVLSQLRRDTE
jgi:hypothetical protein